MPDDNKRKAPHVVARKLLLERMKQLKGEGIEQLPGLRTLCKELGVGLVTLRTAIKQLSRENRIRVVPRKGLFISADAGYLNIGIVLGDGSAVTFLGGAGTSIISGVFDAFRNQPVHPRGIQLRDPERLPGILNNYGLDACIWIWCMPEPDMISRNAAAVAASDVPVVTVMPHYCPSSEEPALPPNRIEPDFFGIGYLRAEFMLKRGHSKIACFTGAANSVYSGFLAAIDSAKAVHKPEWRISVNEISVKIQQILDEGEATAMVVDGGIDNIQNVFNAVEAHPRGSSLELIVDHAGSPLPEIIARHKNVNVVAINYYPGKELGVAAVKSLLANLQGERPLSTIKLTSRIELIDKSKTFLLEDDYAS